MENAPKIEISTQMYERETGVHFKILRVDRSEIHRRRPRQYTFEFSFVGNDTDHCRNLGRVGKQQNPRSSGIFPTNENQA